MASATAPITDFLSLQQALRAADLDENAFCEALESKSPKERRLLGWSALRSKRVALAIRIWDPLDDTVLAIRAECALGRHLVVAAAANDDVEALRWAIRRGVRSADLIDAAGGSGSIEVVQLVAERVRIESGGALDKALGWDLLRAVIAGGNAAAAQLLVLGMGMGMTGVALVSPPRRTVVYDEEGDRFLTTIPGETSAFNLLASAGYAGIISALARTDRGKAVLANPDVQTSHEKGMLAAAARGHADVVEVLVEQCGVSVHASHLLLGAVDPWSHTLASAAVAHAVLPPADRVAAGAAELACARRMLQYALEHGAALGPEPGAASASASGGALATALAAWKRASRDYTGDDTSAFSDPHLHEVVAMVLELGVPVPVQPLSFWGPKYALPIGRPLAAAVVEGIGRRMWVRRRAAVLARAVALAER